MFWGSKEIELEVDDITFNLKQKGFKTELEIIKIERPDESWDLTPDSFFDLDKLYSLQDDEFKQILHKITEPIYEIFDEIQNKKKDWMPDEELEELLGLESVLNNIFCLELSESPDYCDFEQVISGIKKETTLTGYLEEHPYKIEDFFSIFDCEIENLIHHHYASDNKFIDDGYEKYFNIRFDLFMIFWGAFYINEDLLDVINFWREFSRYRCIINHEGCIVDDADEYNKYKFDEDYLEEIKVKYKKQKLKFQEYQKSYFYNQDKIRRSAHIFKDFIIEYKQKLKVN